MKPEEIVVACCLVNSASSGVASERITAADFEDTELGEVFSACVDHFKANGSGLSERAILGHLQVQGVLDKLGTSGQVASLVKAGRIEQRTIGYHASQVASASRTRQAQSVLHQALADLQTRSWDEVAASHLPSLDAIERGDLNELPLTGPELKERAIESLRSDQQPFCPTGIERFDANFGGFTYGSLNVIAARPSVGKSLLACEIGIRAAEQGRHVLVISLEMSDVEIAYRYLSRCSDVELCKFRTGDIKQYVDHLERHELPECLHVWVKPKATMQQIGAMVRCLKQRHGSLDMVIIDYLGLMGGISSNQYERATGNSQEAKQLAVDENVAVVLASQLNREAEKSEATLANLALSGSIEQDADTIMFLHRDKEKAPHELVVKLAKNRNGRLGSLKFEFEGEYARISDNEPMAQEMIEVKNSNKEGFKNDFGNYGSSVL